MSPFISLGIDLASQPAHTAVCLLQWNERGVQVQRLAHKFNDDALLQLVATADSVGIDAPFGWPQAFKEAIVGAAAFQWPHAPGWSDGLRDSLRFRHTDLHLKSLSEKMQPLSVSSELLGVTAMRCAGLLQALGVTDRSGQIGRVFEVYPSASLRRWGLETQGYKGKEDDVRERLLMALLGKAPWLEISVACRRELAQSDHLMDALAASLTAGMAMQHRDLIDPIPERDLGHARIEGWIMLPRPGSLERLFSS
jgi:predicted nuclease with RNAse H fold